MMNRYCYHCGSDQRDISIYDHFLDKYNDKEKAREAANMYGGDGYFYRTVAIYSLEKDKTTQYRCSDCGGIWDR